MSSPAQPSAGNVEQTANPDEVGHPRGTLAIVILFGLLFAVGWLAMYLLRFLPTGAPHP